MEKIPTKSGIKGGKSTSTITFSKIVKRPTYIGVAVKKRRARKSTVLCNHFDIDFKKTKVIQWVAKFSPPLAEDSRSVINDVFMANGRDIKKKLGSFVRSVNCVFTFANPTENAKLFTFNGHKDFSLELAKMDKTLDFSAMTSTGIERFELFRVVNFQIKQLMKANKYVEFGIDRKFFNNNATKELEIMRGDFILKIMQGYKTTMDVYQGKVPKLLIDSCSRIIRGYDLLQEWKFYRGKGMSEEMIIDEFILGRSFLTSYGNQRIYRVEEIDMNMSPSSKFPDSKFKTFTEYYKKQYKVDIQYKKQFMVIAYRKMKIIGSDGKKTEKIEKIHLVPELLLPTGLTDEMRRNNFAMKEIAKYTQVFPDEKNRRHVKLSDQLNKTPAEFNDMGIKIDPDSNVITDALIFDPPKISLKKTFVPRNGVFRIKEPIYSTTASLGKWVIICDDQDKELAKDVAADMKKASGTIRVKVPNPKILTINTQGGRGRSKGPNPAAQAMAHIDKLKDKASIFMFLLPKNRGTDQLYNRVKTECNSNLGVLTQFFTNWNPRDQRKMKNLRDLSILTNIVNQMVVKLGYPIWKVQKPYQLNQNGHHAMVIGGDCFHMSHKDSVASVVATMNQDFTEYYCTNSFQKKKGDDILRAVADKVIDCVTKYGTINKRTPDLIIFFRDGVGMGQHDVVRKVEIAAILEALENFKTNDGVPPKLAYIIVTKRINDRFFEKGKRGPQNPNGGLIIHTKAVKDDCFDYFMVAQNVNRGTATPVHFECLFNNTDLTADTFYELTYYQTFNYYNWSGPIKVPSVVQYATKQAYLIGTTKKRLKVKEAPPQDLERIRKKLYFL